MNQPLDFVTHDLQMMMPNQPMLTGPGMYNTTNQMGGGNNQYGSYGGNPQGSNPYNTNYHGF